MDGESVSKTKQTQNKEKAQTHNHHQPPCHPHPSQPSFLFSRELMNWSSEMAQQANSQAGHVRLVPGNHLLVTGESLIREIIL